jgi:PDZ domain-containing protein
MTTTSTELDTTPAMLPAAAPRPRVARQERAGWRAAVAAGAAAVALLIVASLVTVPYVAIRPGSARPVSQLVRVKGAPSYPTENSVAFTTVSVGQATLLEALQGWLDDHVDVLPKVRVNGDRSAGEARRYNAQLMDVSKATAITVALEHLGYTVPIHTTGTVVRDVTADAPAAAVLQLDDVIVAIDGQAVDEIGEVGRLLAVGGVGADHAVTVERPAGSDTRVEVHASTIGAPDDPNRAILGFVPEERIPVNGFEFPLDVSIYSGSVGGPSAGLAFTLAVLDVLTPGELTGGKRVAVTGTMSLDGSVGPVGGGVQKAITVRNAGYEVFLVPSDEYDEVRDAVGDDLRVVKVDTLDEALDALASLGGNARSLRPVAQGVGS